jgi:hypothetical protein
VVKIARAVKADLKTALQIGKYLERLCRISQDSLEGSSKIFKITFKIIQI